MTQARQSARTWACPGRHTPTTGHAHFVAVGRPPHTGSFKVQKRLSNPRATQIDQPTGTCFAHRTKLKLRNFLENGSTVP